MGEKQGASRLERHRKSKRQFFQAKGKQKVSDQKKTGSIRRGNGLGIILMLACTLLLILVGAVLLVTRQGGGQKMATLDTEDVAYGDVIYDKSGTNLPIACAISEHSKQIILNHNGEKMTPIASLTKLIGLFVVYDALQNGEISLDSPVAVSTDVAALSRAEGLSNVPLDESQAYYTVDQMINASLLPSGNAAAVALAQCVAGSEGAFVERMASKLRDLGIKHFALYSASGLSTNWNTDGSLKAGRHINQMRGIDLLYVCQKLVTTYPDIIERAQLPSALFQVNEMESVEMKNTNEFLPGLAYGRNDVTGLKTGTSEEAGACIIVRSRVGNEPILLLTMGAENNDQRFVQTDSLLDMLQNSYEINQTGDKLQPIEKTSESQASTWQSLWRQGTSMFREYGRRLLNRLHR